MAMKAKAKHCPKCGGAMVKVEPRRWNIFKRPTWVCAFKRVESRPLFFKLGATCKKAT